MCVTKCVLRHFSWRSQVYADEDYQPTFSADIGGEDPTHESSNFTHDHAVSVSVGSNRRQPPQEVVILDDGGEELGHSDAYSDFSDDLPNGSVSHTSAEVIPPRNLPETPAVAVPMSPPRRRMDVLAEMNHSSPPSVNQPPAISGEPTGNSSVSAILSPTRKRKFDPVVAMNQVAVLQVIHGPPGSQRRGPGIPWTEEETQALIAGVKRFGVGNWKQILMLYRDVFALNRRTGTKLKDRWRTINNQR
jgi:hypothetical protein